MAVAAAYVLYVFVEVLVSPYAMVRSLILVIIGTGILTSLAWLLTRNRHTAGLLVLLVLLVLVGWKTPVLLGLAVVLACVAAVLARHIAQGPVPWGHVTRLLNIFGVVLLLAIVINIFSTPALGQIATDLSQGGGLPTAPAVDREGGPPDIVVILFDAYPRADELKRLFDYDNEPFLRALEARGFDIYRDSHSNYAMTELTMASVLNMRLVHDIASLRPLIEGQLPGQPAMRNAMNDSTVLNTFKDHGYLTLATAPGYEDAVLRKADVFLDSGELNEFETLLMREIALGELLPIVAPHFMGDQHRSRVMSGLDHIRSLVKAPSHQPRFLWIHLPTPHAPILFGSEGEPRMVSLKRPFDYDSGGQTKEMQVVQYREQLDFLNMQILAALDEALGQPGRDPVIVLWSDHGSRIDHDIGHEARLHERVRNFLAARTPDHPMLFGDAPTMVNMFPSLLDAYLHTSLPRAEDRYFVSQHPQQFDWIEIYVDDEGGD